MIRIERHGPLVDRVAWVKGEHVVDLTPLGITRVRRDIEVGTMPLVSVTFRAVLVEIEAER